MINKLDVLFIMSLINMVTLFIFVLWMLGNWYKIRNGQPEKSTRIANYLMISLIERHPTEPHWRFCMP